VRWLAVVVVEFCRNTPILVLIIWVHYALPEITGIKTTAVISSVVALVMQSTGYLAEEYRAGIESIDKGQYEAAKSLGMTYARLMAVLPQSKFRKYARHPASGSVHPPCPARLWSIPASTIRHRPRSGRAQLSAGAVAFDTRGIQSGLCFPFPTPGNGQQESRLAPIGRPRLPAAVRPTPWSLAC
jgi:hypothetical protein